MNWILSNAWRRCRQAWQHGELYVLVLALALSVAAASAVGMFNDRLWRALVAQGGDTLGADLIVTSRQPISDDLSQQLITTANDHSKTVVMNSVVWHGEESVLTGIKAIESNYPLRGELRVSAEPYGQERQAQGIPAPGTAWADARLWAALELSTNAVIEVGASTLTVTQLLSHEPDRGAGFADLAPRLIINANDLTSTGLLQPGSRATYGLLLTAEGAALDQLKQIELPDGVRSRSTDDARPEVSRSLNRANDFLNLAAMAAMLLAAAAIGLSAWQYGQRLQPEVALLRCLGARRKRILSSLLISVFIITLFAGVIGITIGYAAQAILAEMSSGLLQQTLPAASLWPALKTMILALLLVAGFVLPALWQASATPPVRVLQQQTTLQHRTWVLVALGLTSLCAAFVVQTGQLRLALLTLLGTLATAAILAALGFVLLQLLQPLRQRSQSGLRLALANLARRRSTTVAQIVAFGLGLLALLLLSVVRQDLLSSWQDRLPLDTPNQFLIDIQPHQVDELRVFLSDRELSNARLWPMARGRLTALNGVEVTADSFDDVETQRWINRDFNMSWTTQLSADNTLTEGDWWDEAGVGQPLLSADSYAKERLNLKLGDTLTLSFAGVETTLTVANFREIDWSSFQPNFFLLTTPGALPDTPTTWLTSFYLPDSERTALRELNREFPNVTAMDLTALMAQVREIIDRIVQAMEFVFLFTLAAGLTVMLAAMEASRDERRREIALLRALGATRQRIRRALLTELAILGALAGAVAAVAAHLIGSLIAQQVFSLPYALNPWLWIYGCGGGAVLVAALGWFSLRSTVNVSPQSVLQSAR
jgi:putative ABC transport system permease protein